MFFVLLALGAVRGVSAVGMGRPLVRRQASLLQAALQEVLAGCSASRMLGVEESVRPTYEALPKNAKGQIPPEDVFPAVVRSYFAKEHGWVVRGFEPPALSPNSTAVRQADGISILRDRAPAVAAALDGIRRTGQGLSMSDLIGTIAAIEQLVVQESVVALTSAYAANGFGTTDALSEPNVHEVLQSYLLIFRYSSGEEVDQEEHKNIKESAKKALDWSSMLAFEQDAFLSADLPGPTYSFVEISAIVEDMAQKYGKWQNAECLDMKGSLLALADSPGLVPFDAFIKEPDHGIYQFRESAEYLASIGALQRDGRPEVRIANYLLGPTNCIAPSRYYAVCCLSECERILGDVEAQVQRPAAPASDLIEAVQRTASVAAPRVLPEEISGALRHVGEEDIIALHGSGFRRWLHSAFPNECPVPTSVEEAAEDGELVAATRWLLTQETCTRLPEWHPLSVSTRGSVLEV
mmetsp:Transcript_44306/g.128108  ORF Transcript_44306/g.128108 Transcript_44306/m.128108 type:complete len:465 (-) Transcript_44306:31-1425(-)